MSLPLISACYVYKCDVFPVASLPLRAREAPFGPPCSLVWRYCIHMQHVSQSSEHRYGKRCHVFSTVVSIATVPQLNTDFDKRLSLFECDKHLRCHFGSRTVERAKNPTTIFCASTYSFSDCPSFSLPAIIHPACFSATQWWQRLCDIPEKHWLKSSAGIRWGVTSSINTTFTQPVNQSRTGHCGRIWALFHSCVCFEHIKDVTAVC